MGASSSNKLNEEKKLYSTFLMQIKILLKSKYIWEKTYNIEITLEEIYKDFLSEKNYEKDFIIKWYFNKKLFELNSTKLKDFLDINNFSNYSTIEFEQEISEINEIKNQIEQLDYIAIPYFNPFKLLIYNIKQRKTNFQKFEDNSLINNEQIKFGVESTYCNGGNHFFILGGINLTTREEICMFLDIDLTKGKIKNQINIYPKKRNHGMLYNQKNVYIVGGNDEKTILYDVETKKIDNLGNLNIKRFEPSLIIHSNYLFCFDATRNAENKFSFEKINLQQKSNWEIIYPKISENLIENIYNQKYFGIAEDNNYNIIFIGGLYINNTEENIEDYSSVFNIKYNLVNNTMEKSNIPFQELSFNEKTLLPLNENENILLLSSFGKNPKIIEYIKEKNNIQITELNVPEIDDNIKKINNSSIKNSLNINSSMNNLVGINLDMPGTNNKRPGVKINIVNSKKKNELINKINEENIIINKDEENKNIEKINENNNNKSNNIIKENNINELNSIPNNEERKNDKPDLEINAKNKDNNINDNNIKILNNPQINNEKKDNNNISEGNINTIVKTDINNKIKEISNQNKENDLSIKISYNDQIANTTPNIPNKNQKLFEPNYISKKKIKKKEREILRNNLIENEEENY